MRDCASWISGPCFKGMARQPGTLEDDIGWPEGGVEWNYTYELPLIWKRVNGH